MENSQPQKLPILYILRLAFGQVILHRVALLQGCAAPLVAMAVASFPSQAMPMRLFGLVASMVGGVMLAVTCHRVLLLGPGSIPNKWGLYFAAREVRYIGYTLLLGLAGAGIFLPPVLITGKAGFNPLISGVVLVGMTVLLSYLSARVFLLLSGITVDVAWTLRAAWATSGRHGWRLVVLFFVAGFLVSIPTVIASGLFLFTGSYVAWLLGLPLKALSIYVVAVTAFAYLFVCPEHLRPERADGVDLLSERSSSFRGSF